MGSVKSGRSRWKTALVTGVVGIGAVAVVGVGVPALAASADGSTTPAQAVSERLTRIKDALTGLVTDGTITQKQADKVASSLDQKLPRPGPSDGWRGMGMRGLMGEVDAVAKTLKLTSQQLIDQLRSGKTLAQIAKAHRVSADTVINQIVKDATVKIDAAVKAGRITQAQATQVEASLKQRVTAFVSNGGPMHGMGGGRMGMGGSMGRGFDHGWNDGGTPGPAPSASASSSGTA